jgi:hypothetical protein
MFLYCYFTKIESLGNYLNMNCLVKIKIWVVYILCNYLIYFYIPSKDFSIISNVDWKSWQRNLMMYILCMYYLILTKIIHLSMKCNLSHLMNMLHNFSRKDHNSMSYYFQSIHLDNQYCKSGYF